VPLTDAKVRTLKPGPTPLKLSDGGGLHLLVQPSGSKLWRMGYRFAGKQKTLAFGQYPAVSLADARAARDDAKRHLRSNVDPSTVNKAQQTAAKLAAASTFRAVAEEWEQRKMIGEGRSRSTLRRTRWLLEFLFEHLGDRPIKEVEPPELLAVLRKAEDAGKLQKVTRLRAVASAVFRYGIACGYCQRDPASDLRGALPAATSIAHAAVIKPAEVGTLMRAIDRIQHDRQRLALRLLALTAVRPAEMVGAAWAEIVGDVWEIPASRTKMRRDHRVPVSRQALSALDELRAITGNRAHLFASTVNPDQPIWMGYRLNSALSDVGFGGDRHVAHGFRSTFSTLANESGLWPADVIELHLAHMERNQVRRAYNRSLRWDERVALMAWYGDLLDDLRARTA
jgi:integrase